MPEHPQRSDPQNHQPSIPSHDGSVKSPTATKTPTPARQPSRPGQDKLPPWKVVLLNDNVNVMQDVVATIKMLTPLSEQAAVRRTLEAHTRGRSLLLTTHRERAELYREQFASRNLTVVIGPA